MTRASPRSLVPLALALLAAPALAQLAPTGGHYAGRPSDTGFAPGAVNASGGYSASIPLDLPPARGDLPVPLAVTSGAPGVGAAGLGWDIPFAFVRRDTSFQHRRPAMGADTYPVGREQVWLTLQGRSMDLIRRGTTNDWVPRRDAPELLLREQGGAWRLFDGAGRTWTFTAPAALAGSGLYLLAAIEGRGGSRVVLEYEVRAHVLPGNVTVHSVDLSRISYNPRPPPHPIHGCFKNVVALRYGPDAPAPTALTMLGDHVLARFRTVQAIDVRARESCGAGPVRLRSYAFSYDVPDADTKLPRLTSVRVSGRDGTPEQAVSLPVSTLAYGSATSEGQLEFVRTQTIPLPAGADAGKIASTEEGNPYGPGVGFGYVTWQTLTDVTGDGRADLLYESAGKLWFARNVPGPGGTTTFAPGVPLQDGTFTTGPLESRTATRHRFNYNNANAEEVWRRAMDFNGDGRVDVVDAGAQSGAWVIYLNTPGPGPSGITWVRRTVSVAKLYDNLRARGHEMENGFVPLSRRFTAHDRVEGGCWRWDGSKWVSAPQSYGTTCLGEYAPGVLLDAGPEKTFTEWTVTDLNGDGYPDVLMNSSRADLVAVPPSLPGAHVGETIDTRTEVRAGPIGRPNRVDVLLNLDGLRFADGNYLFSASFPFLLDAPCGVALWAEYGGTQIAVCDITDVNGDGLADRVESQTTVYLGAGPQRSRVKLTLPGALATQSSGQVSACAHAAPGSTPFAAGQRGGLRDVTGDGIPDFLQRAGTGWTVAVGTGAGFAPAVPIAGTFAFSSQSERCDGKWSRTEAGLFDLDGDGRAEVVRLSGGALEVFQLVGPDGWGRPGAGRLVEVDNGYGAKTSIRYRSAKEDGTTPHQVPFPEIVVASVRTEGAFELGGSIAETRYAYGGAELYFDSALDGFTLAGYARTVGLPLLMSPAGRNDAVATITDTRPLAPFVPTPKNARFGRYLVAGRSGDVTVVRDAGSDPWALLTIDVATDVRRIGATHQDWSARVIEEPNQPGQGTGDCIEIMYPYDYAASFQWDIGSDAINTCAAHGFAHGTSTTTWRGDAAPPSAANVETRSVVTEIDDFGRVLGVLRQGDLHRPDDDVCLEVRYAEPTGSGARVLTAPYRRRIWSCGDEVGTPGAATFAQDFVEYDQLPLGSVSTGAVTGHGVERRDGGTLLETVREFDATYDAAGNLASAVSVREDGAKRWATLRYDPFGLAIVGSRVEGSGTPALEREVTLDPVTLDALSTTDPNLVERGVERDGFGRVTRATIRPPGGQLGVLAEISYVGFTAGDPMGRRIGVVSYPDPVPPPLLAVAPGRKSVVFLDELGRQRREEVSLGGDYQDERLIAFRTFDGLGRVRFEADPFPSAQGGTAAYGTTHHYQPTGFPSCVVRGYGEQPPAPATDEPSERYPTCFSRTFTNHEEVIAVRDAASLLAGSQQAGVSKSETLSAIGWITARSTLRSGSRLEHAVFRHDRLGNTTAMTRYGDPVNLGQAVTAYGRFDSMGRPIESSDDPESAARRFTFSAWGELKETRWVDPTTSPPTEYRLVAAYDALGRVTHREERVNGAVDAETSNDYAYDTAAPGSIFAPTYLLGRMTRATAPSGSVAFSYDAFGHTDARTFVDASATPYAERSSFRADGPLTALELYLPDTGYAPERVEYAYDSAARLRRMTSNDGATGTVLFDATKIDPLGRLREATFGGVTDLSAVYAETGRRLLKQVRIASPYASRTIELLGFDPVGRERSRVELRDGAPTGPQTTRSYDALGRLQRAVKTEGTSTVSSWLYGYDPLGNLTHLDDVTGALDATMSVRPSDRDRICRIGYGNAGLGGTACNVTYDGVGDVVTEPTRSGLQQRYGWFGAGAVRKIVSPAAEASFRYDAFGQVQELDVTDAATLQTQRERAYGGHVQRRTLASGGSSTTLLSRRFPGPGGVVASRRGDGGPWVFELGEGQGTRYVFELSGKLVQTVDYQPYGEATSGGATPGTALYTGEQWNGGEVLAAFGLSRLGARLYDPVIGRFLSRDPLRIPRTAATSNAYAFAMDDPVNRSDPSGLDPTGCLGDECRGLTASDVWFGGGGWGVNDPRLYLPRPDGTSQASPQACFRAQIPTEFLNTPIEPQTAEHGAERAEAHGGEGPDPLDQLEPVLRATDVALTTADGTLGLLGLHHENWFMQGAKGAGATLALLEVLSGLGELREGNPRGYRTVGVGAAKFGLLFAGPPGVALSLMLTAFGMSGDGPQGVDPELLRILREGELQFYEDQARAYDEWYYATMTTCWEPVACGDTPGAIEWGIRNTNPILFGSRVYENQTPMQYDLDFPIVQAPQRLQLDRWLAPRPAAP